MEGEERRGGWHGERESSRRQAAHLIKAQQWAIAASSATVSQKKYRRKEEGERREGEDGTGRGKAVAGKPLTLSRRSSGRGERRGRQGRAIYCNIGGEDEERREKGRAGGVRRRSSQAQATQAS